MKNSMNTGALDALAGGNVEGAAVDLYHRFPVDAVRICFAIGREGPGDGKRAVRAGGDDDLVSALYIDTGEIVVRDLDAIQHKLDLVLVAGLHIVGSNVVDVYVRMLRKKVDADFEPKLIQTVRGYGYVLKEPEK